MGYGVLRNYIKWHLNPQQTRERNSRITCCRRSSIQASMNALFLSLYETLCFVFSKYTEYCMYSSIVVGLYPQQIVQEWDR